MFTSKTTHTRVIDPNQVIIEPTFIAAPLPNGKMLILHGKFDDTPREEIQLLVNKTIAKFA